MTQAARLILARVAPASGLARSRLRAKRRSRAILRRVVLAGARAVLVHDHVEYPVKAVFDLPVGAHDLGEAGGAELRRAGSSGSRSSPCRQSRAWR